jgi:predicted DNA-binding transcriptional regulator YafY
MSRTERLLDLLQLLRRHRSPISGAALASELGVSLRSLYRDIATLRGQGAGIEGEPGAAWIVAIASCSSLPPYMLPAPIPMQPRAKGKTSGPEEPSLVLAVAVGVFEVMAMS